MASFVQILQEVFALPPLGAINPASHSLPSLPAEILCQGSAPKMLSWLRGNNCCVASGRVGVIGGDVFVAFPAPATLTGNQTTSWMDSGRLPVASAARVCTVLRRQQSIVPFDRPRFAEESN